MTHAILLTDLVDSTKMSMALGDAAMGRVWAAHDRLARDLLPRYGGREYDRTDGFLILFDHVADAAAYACAYHAALQAADPPLVARAGLHRGPLRLTHNTPEDIARGAKPVEADGAAKALAAQIMALAGGGQTLLTDAAHAALGAAALPTASLGHWRLRGSDAPLELFALAAPDAALSRPAETAAAYRVVPHDDLWLPARDIPHSLPRERDRFVGRSAPLQRLADQIDHGAALVSVLGVGGTGKTRLVTRFGWTRLGDWPGGVWFCDLSEARDEDGIASAVAGALGVQLGKDDPVVQLGHTVASRGRCLVILDNFEQVARHAADTLGRWLDRAPEARFVVTTREVLGLPGEVVLALAPLERDEAAALFASRAAQAHPGWALSAADAPHVQSLVVLLDGLPLAIELAAAQVRTLSPETIRARMGERFDLLAAAGARHTRQATLRGALDWSWDLLSPDEQQALAQLSVFEGGFTLEHAEAVLALDALWPVDALQALVDKSLVRPLGDGRFDLLVSVQAYAAEKLAGFGGRPDAEQRHGDCFAALGSAPALAARDCQGDPALTADLDNLLAAIRRAAARADAAVAVPALRAAWQQLEVVGPLRLAVDLAGEVLALPALPAPLAAPVHLIRGTALTTLGLVDAARGHLEAAQAAAGAAGDRGTEATARAGLADLHREATGDPSVVAAYEHAVALARADGSSTTLLRLLYRMGDFHLEQGRMVECRVVLEEALAVARASGARRQEGQVVASLGCLHEHEGRLADASAAFQAALVLHRGCGDRRAEGVALGNLGEVFRLQGLMDDARAHFAAAIAVHQSLGNVRMQTMVLSNLGILNCAQGRLDEARTQHATALQRQRDAGYRRQECLSLLNLGEVSRVQGRLDEARAHYDAALALSRETGRRLVEAYVLAELGTLALRNDRPDEARAHCDAALALARELRAPELEGAVLGSRGAVDLRQGRLTDAQAHLDAGIDILRGLDSLVELARQLCSRAALALASGHRDRARQDLAEAEALALRVQAGPASDLGQRLAAARAALASA